MTNKPLDCTGPTGNVGKHDFRENPAVKAVAAMEDIAAEQSKSRDHGGHFAEHRDSNLQLDNF